MNNKKFRIFSKKLNSYLIFDEYQGPYITMDGKVCGVSTVGQALYDEYGECVIEQYTGQNLEDGTPVYEGDILFNDHVALNSNNVFFVKWSECYSGYRYNLHSCETGLEATNWYYGGLIFVDYPGVKIIGNVNQNKELLIYEN